MTFERVKAQLVIGVEIPFNEIRWKYKRKLVGRLTK